MDKEEMEAEAKAVMGKIEDVLFNCLRLLASDSMPYLQLLT